MHLVTHERAGQGRRRRAPAALSRSRRIAGFLTVLAGLPALTAVGHPVCTRSADADAEVKADDDLVLLETADVSLDRLIRLITNLLDMSRLQAGALGVEAVDVGAEEIVPRALDDLGPPGRAVQLHIPDDLPYLHADPGLLERVIDHGPGIPEDRWDDVFLPFQRLGDRDNHTGAGLGLALSRGLTEAMGGTLTPDQTPGGGLTMVVSLPSAPPRNSP